MDVKPGGFDVHEYVPPTPAPPAVKVEPAPPVHIDDGTAEAVTVGLETIVTAVSITKLQPAVPVRLIVQEYVPEQVTFTD